jgi:23S rRNA (adenine2030-N6)-methyltransferase
MNYRHAYHAGNFADVLKHATLALVIEYLKRKEAPLRVIDTHAGRGLYDLSSVEAKKTGEWRGGIGRLIGREAAPLPAQVARVLAPYLDIVRAENSPDGQEIATYPGSPLIAHRLLRPQDTLVASELHPEEVEQLEALFARRRAVKVLALDGWMALKSLLPPKERRGVVLIDPPFEEESELSRLAEGLAEGLKRFATGVYLAWYPIKDPKAIARFHSTLAELRETEILRVELMIRRASDPDRLNGCGLIVANPPYTLQGDLEAILPDLSRRLADGAGAGHRLDRIGAAKGGAIPFPERPPRRGRKR